MKAIFYEPADNGKTFDWKKSRPRTWTNAKKYREELFDVLTRHDDKDRITTAILEGQELPLAALHEVIREQTIKGSFIPFLAGSGREHVGIQPLLDAVTYYLPSPLDRPPVTGREPAKRRRGRKAQTRCEGRFLRLGLQSGCAEFRRSLLHSHLFGGRETRQPGLLTRDAIAKEFWENYTTCMPTDSAR